MADEWFPKEYKVFKYREGDLLSFQIDGKWGLTKILKIDKVSLKRGDSISIQDQVFKAPIDDYLLVISTSCEYVNQGEEIHGYQVVFIFVSGPDQSTTILDFCNFDFHHHFWCRIHDR